MRREIRAGIITASDRSAAGERPDTGGPAVRELLEGAGISVAVMRVLPDDRHALAEALKEMADDLGLDFVAVTGGTGLGPRDLTPEAVRDVVESEVPGLGEAMRAEGRKHTPFADLSRSMAGTRGRCLIVALPGSPRAAREGLQVVLPLLPHAVSIIAGGQEHPRQPVPHGGGGKGMAPALAFVGPSGCGKTTLIEKVIPCLVDKGLRVATLKHDTHGFAMDHPGKDTWRHSQAGAVGVSITSKGDFAVLGHTEEEIEPEGIIDILRRTVKPDVIIVEGYKRGPFPKIAVARAGAEKAFDPEDRLLIAVATDMEMAAPVPVLPLNDPRAVAEFVAAWTAAQRGEKEIDT